MNPSSFIIFGILLMTCLGNMSCVHHRRMDRREDVIDRVENRIDESHWSGPGDRIEDKHDRREDRWDRRGF